MPRGMFTQCFVVLVQEPVTLDAVEQALAGFPIQGRFVGSEHWAMGGPSIALAFRPEVNGIVLVDAVDHPWPDEMGNPQTQETIFTAWTMGHFGPITYPASLQRAMQQCWSWKEGRTVPAEHKGFVRVRISYVMGAPDEAPVMPKDWDAATEMHYLSKIIEALLTLPGAVCYFNPNGEMLRDREGLSSQLAQAASEKMIPFDLWINVRLYPYDTDWVLMDTVGNGQLNDRAHAEELNDLPDVEALFRTKFYDYGEVDSFLRDLTRYMHAEGDVIKEGDTIEGPGKIPWRANLLEKAVAMPLRRVIRVAPVDGTEPPLKPA
jgi:hypothetical protein